MCLKFLITIDYQKHNISRTREERGVGRRVTGHLSSHQRLRMKRNDDEPLKKTTESVRYVSFLSKGNQLYPFQSVTNWPSFDLLNDKLGWPKTMWLQLFKFHFTDFKCVKNTNLINSVWSQRSFLSSSSLTDCFLLESSPKQCLC